MIARLVLGFCLCASVCGQELVVRDLRLGVVSRPVGFDYAMSSPTAERSGHDAFDAGLGLELGGRWSLIRSGSRFGLLLGGDVQIDRYSYDGSGALSGQSLRLCTGVAAALDDRWTSALEVGWLRGRSRLSIAENSSLPALDASGRTSGWDLRLTAERMLTRRFGLGAICGWAVMTHKLSDRSVDLTLDQSGWFIGLEARWRFHDRPPLLD